MKFNYSDHLIKGGYSLNKAILYTFLKNYYENIKKGIDEIDLIL